MSYWWNPLVWFVRRELHAAEEACCDAAVLRLLPGRAGVYGDALLRTNQFLASGCVPRPMLASGVRQHGSLKRRVEMILGNEFASPLSRAMSVLLVLAAFVILPLAGKGILAQDDALPETAAAASEDVLPTADAELQQLLMALGTKKSIPFHALNELIKRGDEAITPTRLVMNDREQPVTRRWQAAKVLGALKAKAAVPDLLAIVEGDDNAIVVRVAVEALGVLGDGAVIPRLQAVLERTSDPLTKRLLENAVVKLEGRAAAQLSRLPANMDFEGGAKGDGFPNAWAGGGSGYELSLDMQTFHQGNGSGRVRQVGDGGRFGSLTNGTSALPYIGKRIRYSGFLRTEAAGAAGLWMRVDSVKSGVVKPVAFDNMSRRSVTGTTDWSEYSVVLDVPKDADSISFGFLLSGVGTVWVMTSELKSSAVSVLALK